MSGLRDIFFKPKVNPAQQITNFINLDDLVIRMTQKQGLTRPEVDDLIGLCTKYNRDDLVDILKFYPKPTLTPLPTDTTESISPLITPPETPRECVNCGFETKVVNDGITTCCNVCGRSPDKPYLHPDLTKDMDTYLAYKERMRNKPTYDI
jgi:hypothetical protein